MPILDRVASAERFAYMFQAGPAGRAFLSMENYMREIDPEFPAWVRADGKKREIAFDFVEEIYGNTLRRGEEGIALYVDLLEKVRQAGPEAVWQYQQRFAPMLDPALVKKWRIDPMTDAGEVFRENKQEDASRRKVLDEAENTDSRRTREREDRRSKGFFRRLFGG
jgi:hypothetical protein